MSKRYKKYKKYKKESSYTLVAGISYFIRQFLLPNPFSNLFESGTAELVDWLFGGVLIALAYILTGIWYVSKKGDYWKGSLGFLINFSVLTGLILLISKFITNIYWVSGIFVCVYIILCILEVKLLNKNNSIF